MEFSFCPYHSDDVECRTSTVALQTTHRLLQASDVMHHMAVLLWLLSVVYLLLLRQWMASSAFLATCRCPVFRFHANPPSRHILHQNLPVPTRESVRAAPSLLSTLRGILFRVRPEASPIHTITKPTKKQKIRSATSDFYRISEVGDLIIWC